MVKRGISEQTVDGKQLALIDEADPPLKRDFVVQRLGGIDVQQEGVFTIDIAVMRVFSKHPLVNAIMWDYLCASSQTDDIISDSFDGPHGSASQNMIRSRFVTPDDAPRVFWKLYRTWFTPSHAQITRWKVDILHHVRQIHEDYNANEGAIFSMEGGIVDAMEEEFPQTQEALRTAFEESGFDNACEIYESLLDDHDNQQALVKIIDWREPWRTHDFHVIDYCIRLLSDFRHGLIQEVAAGVADMTVDTVLDQVARSARGVETKELKFWTMVANPIHDNFQIKMTNLNQVEFWANPHVQTMTNFEDECAMVREAVQRIVMYADLDPDRGINPAIDMVNDDSRGKEWSRDMFGHMIQTLHSFDRPMPTSRGPKRAPRGLMVGWRPIITQHSSNCARVSPASKRFGTNRAVGRAPPSASLRKLQKSPRFS